MQICYAFTHEPVELTFSPHDSNFFENGQLSNCKYI